MKLQILFIALYFVPSNLQLSSNFLNVFNPFQVQYRPLSGYGQQTNIQFTPLSNFNPSNIPTTGSCSQYFTYFGTFNKYGVVTIPQYSNFYPPKSEVIITLVSTSLNYLGNLYLLYNENVQRQQLANGQPLKLRVDLTNPTPQIKEVIYNGEKLCSQTTNGNHEVTLKYTYLTDLPAYNYNRYQTSQVYPTTFPATYPTTTLSESKTKPTTMTIPKTTSIITTQMKSSFTSTTKTTTLTTRTTTNANSKTQTNFEKIQKICGKPDDVSNITPLIYHGENARKGQFPWIAALLYEDKFFCGGSLISQKLVLTAAHCFQGKQISEITRADLTSFIIGAVDIKKVDDEDVIKVDVEKLILHPQWNINDLKYNYDIAAAVLKKKVQFDTFKMPICIWTETSDYRDMINSKGIVVGWGITEENVPSNDAKFINSPVIDGEVCTDSHFGYYEIKGTTTFCAGIPNSNMNPCKGDSGGPFIYFNQKAKRFYLRGIVSTGLVLDRNKECDGSLYSLYSDVSKSTSWIKDLINVYG